jgi:hypothetical protein
MLNDLNNKIIIPFLKTSGLSEEEQKKVSQIVSQIVEQSLLIAILEALTDQEKKELTEKLLKVKEIKEKSDIYTNLIENNTNVKKAVKKYLEEELPKFIEEIVTSFLKKATPKQKAKYSAYSQN